MSEASVETLFDEFAMRYVRGDQPDVGQYLDRAGADRDELGGLIDRFLQVVPAREPTEEEVVLMQARLEQEPPLLVLRLRRRLSRGAVVDAIVRTLGLDPAKRDKVAGYYHRLEVGTLDPERVDRSIWDVLADVLMANARLLASVRPAPPPSAPAFLRRSIVIESSMPPGLMAKLDALETSSVAPGAVESDEIDTLFTSGI